MIDLLKSSLAIRYVKLHFTIEFMEDSNLPISKTSAIRGGIGQMLLNANCISDRNCEACDFATECIVRRTMYSVFDKKPDFITTGDSVGYVFECENYEEFFPAGSLLNFNLILFGKTICYFSQYVQAIYALGQTGLGKSHARFVISRITNTHGEDIMSGNDIIMSNYKIATLADYVEYRLKSFEKDNSELNITFKSPATLRYKNEFLSEFNMEAIIRAVQRRIYILDCFENIDGKAAYDYNYILPTIQHQNVRKISTQRYSSRQDAKMSLKGIKGDIAISNVDIGVLPVLLAGELIHIGKNTSFGFGRYHVTN